MKVNLDKRDSEKQLFWHTYKAYICVCVYIYVYISYIIHIPPHIQYIIYI